MSIQLRSRYHCPVEFALELVRGKWKMIIIAYLKEAPHRYKELRTKIHGISDKVMNERLQDLLHAGLIMKAPIADGSDITVYSLTELGEGLRPVAQTLYDWGSTMAREMDVEIGPVER